MRKTLPEKYYLDHFFEFLEFFSGVNQALLDTPTLQFIDDFRGLSTDQQCIVVRAANRKYPVVATKTFAYAEINCPLEQLDNLTRQGWFVGLEKADSFALGQGLTKADLLVLLNANGVTLPAAVTKPVVTEQLAERLLTGPLHVPDELNQHYKLRNFDRALDYLLFLYFGNTKGRLNQFSMRDLGVMRTRKDVSQQLARFNSQTAALGAFYFAKELSKFKSLTEQQKAHYSVVDNVTVECAIGHDYRNRLLYQAGIFWLSHDHRKGLMYLQRANSDQAREKWLRESYKAGDKDDVKTALEAIIDDPPSDTLLAFAEDFYTRKFGRKKTSVLTDMLRDATRVIHLDELHNQEVEQGVIGYYRRHGIAAYRTENHLWRTLFGLLFWQWLHGDRGLVNEFDRRPQVLRHNDFYATFGHEIDAHLEQYCESSDTLYRYLLMQAGMHYGKVNSLFMWREQLLDNLKVMLSYIDIALLREFLLLMCKDYASLSDGFPDIMVVDDGELRFEEIKAPGDQLRRNQLVSIQRLKQCGFKVNVTQVNWYSDPMQPYVVVDIETTGGQSAAHRITEVGMVKMINGEEVARWSSLINPQRHIPGRITQLTGISNDMVADAPIFADVVEDIEAFSKDCIFVAHNVNFDYGFIKQEFARLGMDFRRPKLCTCARMRKHYPGIRSYGLGALSEHFEIKLENHHRALDDALAAAQLLKLIQQAQSAV